MPGERGAGGTPGAKGEKVSSGEIHLFTQHCASLEQELLF